MSGSDKRDGGLTRKELIGSGVTAAAAALLAQSRMRGEPTPAAIALPR